MRSSSYEAALTRFEARINSPMLSDITRGLIGVLRGDDGTMYFQMLSHDMKQLELQRLKARAMKIPPKIRVFSLCNAYVFLMTIYPLPSYMKLYVPPAGCSRRCVYVLKISKSKQRREGYIDVAILVLLPCLL